MRARRREMRKKREERRKQEQKEGGLLSENFISDFVVVVNVRVGRGHHFFGGHGWRGSSG